MTTEEIRASDLVPVFVICAMFGALIWHTIRRELGRQPAGIVKRLFSTDQPVTHQVSRFGPTDWDPRRPYGGFLQEGTVTYTLERPATVHVRFVPKSGPPSEGSGPIPAYLMPETPEARRRRTLANRIVALYLTGGLAAFALTAALMAGSASLRVTIAALVALVAVAGAWAITHVVLLHRRANGRENAAGGPAHRFRVTMHRIAVWTAGYAIVTAAFAVAWRIGNEDQEHPYSWAGAFLSAAIFVLAAGTAVAASLHHHTYIHHEDRAPTSGQP